ncbi:MAG: hypothetical protein AB1347_07675 [Acidobacteriota bacterium]
MVHPGAYRGNKRQKELKRLQKQEEKRQKRLLKKADPSLEEPPEEAGGPPSEAQIEGASADAASVEGTPAE